jgi:hypothetical protein
MPRMKRKHGRLLSAAIGVAVAGTFVAAALGSAGSGLVSTFLVAKADNNEIVHLNSDGIKFQTKGRTDVRIRTITFDPGGHSGWHHDPGFALVTVASGEVTEFDSKCNSTTYGPNSPNGAVFVEYGDEPGDVRNMGTAPATIYSTVVAPSADPPVFRIEDDPPPCA